MFTIRILHNIKYGLKSNGTWRQVCPRHTYLSRDYLGTRQIIFDNNKNAIGNYILYQVRGQISCIRISQFWMCFYSIHVIVEYNLAGAEIICRQIHALSHSKMLFPISTNLSGKVNINLNLHINLIPQWQYENQRLMHHAHQSPQDSHLQMFLRPTTGTF